MKNSGPTVLLTLSILLLAFGLYPAVAASTSMDQNNLRRTIYDFFNRIGCPDVAEQVTQCTLAEVNKNGNSDVKVESCEVSLGGIEKCNSHGIDYCRPLNSQQKFEAKAKIKEALKNVCIAAGLSVIVYVIIGIVNIVITVLCIWWCCRCCCGCCK